ncbi:MAG: hypothetical protein L0Y56_10060 [Nitrospira sp.]|nr:hypothetical protein [Nitrospira sp.]
MMRSIPKEFLEEYEAKRDHLQKALEEITSLVKLRLGQLATRTGVRGRITEARVKRPAKLWKNARKAGLSVSEVFTRIEDLVGIRIVCNNLSDIALIVGMIRTDCSILSILETKDMVSLPSQAGYRATHVRAELRDLYTHDDIPIPCEIQIRTLAQDTWARLSRADLYGKDVPPSIQRLAQALSTQLSAIDEIGQLIRDELNRCPSVPEEISDSDYISPQRLALLYKHKFVAEIYEWTLIDWVRYLDEAEIEKIGEVRILLDDTKIRKTLDMVSTQVRGFPLENNEWVVYSALVASEVSTASGIKAVRERIKDEWDEIITIAHREVLSEMPDTLEEFVEMVESGSFPINAVEEFGGIESCNCCGVDIFRPAVAAGAILEYYGSPDDDMDLERLLEESAGEEMPEIGSAGNITGSWLCQHCQYELSRGD